MLIAHDIETLKGMFCVVAYCYDTKQTYTFEISDRKNELKEMKKFYSKVKTTIGFNSVHFDDPIMSYILSQSDISYSQIYEIAQAIINNEKDYYLYNELTQLKYTPKWKQVDLFLFWSRGLRISKKLSLKSLAHSLGMSIEEMPIHHSRENLTTNEIELILSYCKNDILVTVEISKNNKIINSQGAYTKEELLLRFYIEKEYKIPKATIMDAPKIASEYLLSSYTQDKEERKRLRMYQGSPVTFKNGDYIPQINFKTEFFQNIYKEVCGAYNGFNKEFLFRNSTGEYIKISLGSGGIHSLNTNEVYKSTDNKVILDVDIQSQYPNLMILYKMLREDLNSVLERYSGVKDERVLAKKNKEKTKDKFFKLILNS